MYKNTNCFHLAIPCGDLETAKKFYSETLGCRLDNSAQEWADVDFWGNELTLHASEHKLDNERHDVDMGNVSVPSLNIISFCLLVRFWLIIFFVSESTNLYGYKIHDKQDTPIIFNRFLLLLIKTRLKII